jgi:hypothetical protein
VIFALKPLDVGEPSSSDAELHYQAIPLPWPSCPARATSASILGSSSPSVLVSLSSKSIPGAADPLSSRPTCGMSPDHDPNKLV